MTKKLLKECRKDVGEETRRKANYRINADTQPRHRDKFKTSLREEGKKRNIWRNIEQKGSHWKNV